MARVQRKTFKFRALPRIRMSKKIEFEDFLDEDPELPGQKWALVSFLSPEKVLEEKEKWMFRKFLQDYEVKWKTVRLEAWMAGQLQEVNTALNALAGKLRDADQKEAATTVESNTVQVAKFVEGFQAFMKEELKSVTKHGLQDDFDDFLFQHGDKLEDEFHAAKDFQTTIRGIKVRGVYATEAEAAARAKRLQKTDKLFNIYGASVGKWTPWDPDPNKIQNQEYANEQLNTLMKKYNQNQEERDQFYQEQKKRRTAKKEAEQKGEELKPIEITLAGDGAEGQGTAVVPSEAPATAAPDAANPFTASNAAGGEYDGMFSGSGDLAIQRKMEAAADAGTREEKKE